MKAALYLRVSTADQAERGFSLPDQRRRLEEYCRLKGWDFEFYEDAGISGETIDARPAMIRLLEDARKRRFQVAIAIEMERFSRSESLLDWLIIKQAFRQGQVKFGTPGQVYDPADEEDDFLTDLFGALAKREKRKIIVRTQRGKKESARRGNYVAPHPPYGYRKNGAKLEIYKPEAQIVRTMFDLLFKGYGTRTIVQTLNDHGILPRDAKHQGRRTWALSTVKKILKNETYIGRWTYNKQQRILVEGKLAKALHPRPDDQWVRGIAVPRILSDEIFAQAQEQLQRNRELSRRNQQHPYLLKALVRCGICGRPMPGACYDTRRYHQCAGMRRLISNPPCPARSIRADLLEQIVWNQLTKLLQQPALVLEEARRWMQNRVSDRDELEMRLGGVESALGKIEDKRERMLTLHREGEITLPRTGGAPRDHPAGSRSAP